MRARVSSPSAPGLISRLPGRGALAVVRDGPRTVVALSPSRAVRATGAEAFAALDTMTEGWWAGFIAYDLGRAIERVPNKNAPVLGADVLFVRFETQIVIDGAGVTVEGSDVPSDDLLGPTLRDPRPSGLPSWTSSLDRGAYLTAVDVIREHLGAGNCYQVNLTRTLTADGVADPLWLFGRLRARNPAPHEALIRLDDLAVVSASPESFLRIDGRNITTRPIKGTSADPDRLRASAKDRSENVMIVDLARNDLGRVCEYGTVRVRELCALEAHPGLYHLVSTVDGTLRADVTLGDTIRATFPPASVTGCPKPRVMQIIEELEPVRRGVYCGAIGFVDADRGVCDLNVAIRTFTITEGRTTFGVGGGIVAESDPSAEWDETELKASRLLEIASGA